jgi:vacuolar protein sorting-associated protein 29
VSADKETQIQGDVLVLYVYQLKTDANGVENVSVEKVSYRKNHAPAPAATPAS